MSLYCRSSVFLMFLPSQGLILHGHTYIVVLSVVGQMLALSGKFYDWHCTVVVSECDVCGFGICVWVFLSLPSAKDAAYSPQLQFTAMACEENRPRRHIQTSSEVSGIMIEQWKTLVWIKLY